MSERPYKAWIIHEDGKLLLYLNQQNGAVTKFWLDKHSAIYLGEQLVGHTAYIAKEYLHGLHQSPNRDPGTAERKG